MTTSSVKQFGCVTRNLKFCVGCIVSSDVALIADRIAFEEAEKRRKQREQEGKENEVCLMSLDTVFMFCLRC